MRFSKKDPTILRQSGKTDKLKQKQKHKENKMANQYRTNFVDKVIADLDADVHVDLDRLNTAIQYLDSAQEVLERKAERLVAKEMKDLQKANKEADQQLSEEELEEVEQELTE